MMNWMMAAILVCGASVFTSCSNDNSDNPTAGDALAEKIVGKWIHTDTEGEEETTGTKSVYTFMKEGSVLKGYFSMSMAESGVWANRQPMKVTVNGTDITLTSQLADGMTSLVELTGVSVSGDDMRFTAKTTLSKNGRVTATYGPRQEHFTRTEGDYSKTLIGLWEIQFTCDDPAYGPIESCRDWYGPDGTYKSYLFIDGQWVEEVVVNPEYFIDGPMSCYRWQDPDSGKELRENWEIVSCGNGEMVSKSFYRRADGSTYTITSHGKKLE